MISKNFPEKNVLLGKNQAEYSPLHAHITPQGDVVCCFELSEKEVEKVLNDKSIKITRLTFGNRLQPMPKSIIKPKFGPMMDYHTSQVHTCLPPLIKIDNTQPVNVVFVLDDKEIKQIQSTKCVWITTFSFGAPYQPIRLEV